MGLQEVKSKIDQIYSNDISIIEESYIDTKHRALFICNKHQKEFSAFLTNVLYGSIAGCELCKLENKRKIDLENVIPKIHNKPLKIIGHHIVKSHVYIDFKCLNCNREFSQRKDSIVYKNNNIDCPYCDKKKAQFLKNGFWEFKRNTEEYKKEVYDLVGNEYSVIEDYKGSLIPIKMKHNICGNIWKIRPNNFLSSYRRCPYCISSKGEKRIEDFLKNNNISFERQKKFDNLFGVKNRYLSYDFYLHKYNLLIEYQGKQHCNPIDYFGGQETFEIQQEHDQRKRKYATDNHINLLEIWYYDFDNIENILKTYLIA